MSQYAKWAISGNWMAVDGPSLNLLTLLPCGLFKLGAKDTGELVNDRVGTIFFPAPANPRGHSLYKNVTRILCFTMCNFCKDSQTLTFQK